MDKIKNIKDTQGRALELIPAAPTETERGGIVATTVDDTTNMEEVVVGKDGRGYVSNEKSVLMERTRAKLERILKNKGVYVEEGTPLNELVSKCNELSDKNAIDKFYNEELLEERNDNAVIISDYKFYNQKTITKVYFPNVIAIGTHAFSKCSSLRNIYFPKLETINGYDPFTDTAVENMIFPRINVPGHISRAFCSRILKRLIATNSNSLGSSPFASLLLELIDSKTGSLIKSTSLKILICRNTDKIPTLSSAEYILNIEEIYITSSLVDTLKTATNWSVYEDKISPLEGSKYENEKWYETEEWYKEEMAVW